MAPANTTTSSNNQQQQQQQQLQLQPVVTYVKDERVFCFHWNLMYEAKIVDTRLVNKGPRKGTLEHRVHYKGWKTTWDDWVPQDRLRKFTEENRELAQNLKKEMEALQQQKPSKDSTGKRMSTASNKMKKGLAGGGGGGPSSDFSSTTRGGSEEDHRHSSVVGAAAAAAVPQPRGQKRGRDYYASYEIEKEDHFHSRPSVRLTVPDQLKGLLVDDWENVTKNLQLVPLPSAHPVNVILRDYFNEESARRRPGSAEFGLLEEMIQGTREYFEKAIGRILLYRFERDQFAELIKLWENNTDGTIKGPADVYGAEHLSRLFVSLPELIAQTNMSNDQTTKLRSELVKITHWLSRNAARYFTSDYENASQAYIEKARGL